MLYNRDMIKIQIGTRLKFIKDLPLYANPDITVNAGKVVSIHSIRADSREKHIYYFFNYNGSDWSIRHIDLNAYTVLESKVKARGCNCPIRDLLIGGCHCGGA